MILVFLPSYAYPNCQREAEEGVQHGISKEHSAPPPLPLSDPGISSATATTATAAAAAAVPSDGSGNVETAVGVDGRSAGALASAPSPSRFAWSFGGRNWWGRGGGGGGGRGTCTQRNTPGTWGERQPGDDVAETVKAAEVRKNNQVTCRYRCPPAGPSVADIQTYDTNSFFPGPRLPL